MPALRHLVSLLLVSLVSLLPLSLASAPACVQPPAAGPCDARIPRWYFDNHRARCRKFIWGGCDGSVPFSTERSCHRANCIPSHGPGPVPLSPKHRCNLRPLRGPCPGASIRWWWNRTAKKCMPFRWGGCFGVVPFRTRRQCLLARCAAAAPVNPCALVPETGPCRARFVRWFFDASAKVCKSFIWGGCGGVVPFETREACEGKCPVDDDCVKEPDAGLCEAAIQKWFYNPATRMCESFSWGGCGGTVPFDSKVECENRKCRCTQKPAPGPCKGSFQRWFFEQENRSCTNFIYGGCQGSVPFDTEEMCVSAQC